MIKLENINFSYDNKTVLNDFSLNFEKDKITCLLGGSGSGKTTVLRIIAGLETPSSGKVVIDDKIVSDKGRIIVPPFERNAGFIFQDLALWPHMSVYENVAFGLKESGEKNVKKKTDEILDFFEIKNQSSKLPSQLSGGQQQLVAIARSLVLKPKIMLMDEPLANLDVVLKRKILNFIGKLKSEFNLTVVYVTHDHREAFSIADKVVLINKGRIEVAGPVNEIKSSKNEFAKYFLEF